MNAYDFDGTIYKGDCFIDFYFFCFIRRPYLIIMLPFQLLFVLFTFYNRKLVKQSFAIYLLILPSKIYLVKEFWNKHIGKIKKWYLAQRKDDDIIISASPRFILQEIVKRLHLKNLICTEMNMHTGFIKGKNCYGNEKVARFNNEYPSLKLNAFYSDSKSDLPMMNIAENGYLVKKNKITKF